MAFAYSIYVNNQYIFQLFCLVMVTKFAIINGPASLVSQITRKLSICFGLPMIFEQYCINVSVTSCHCIEVDTTLPPQHVPAECFSIQRGSDEDSHENNILTPYLSDILQG